ncbi:MAG: GIY-YIG nuclease family protein [Actinobacteria bacterium]|nr:GIY-YIG nuclease family protein [Actinomycetota bacterium]
MAVDLETTGLDHRTERIIEIGAVRMVGDHPIETFEQLINPNRLIPSKITRLTGITNDMVCGTPDIEVALPAFADFVKDSILIIHSAPFDISFLNRAARNIGQKSFRNDFFDTKLIAQKLRPRIGFYGLANLAEYFGVSHRPCHRALPDAIATAEIFTHLLEIMRSEGLRTVDEANKFFYPKKRYDFSHKKSLASALPRSSGAYLMRDDRGKVIYVGKAKDLRKRVRSYFYSGPKSKRQLSLISEVKTIDYIKTGTEIGALLLESKLIKKLKPAYNILGKRYRRYPFVHIDQNDNFPTPRITRTVTGVGIHYGPFSNTADLELLLEVAKDLYRLKQCDYKIKPSIKKQPCFYYQVNRCSGPCCGMISPQDYRNRLTALMDAFDGHPEGLRRELIKRRDSAASKLHFEKAALFNRSIDSLERTVKLLEGIKNTRANLDFLLLEKFKNRSRIYLVADGQLRSCITIKSNRKDIAKLERKVARIYFASKNRSDEITVEQIENLSLLSAYFNKLPVVRVKVGASINDTLNSILMYIAPKQPYPSIETSAYLDSLSPLQFQSALYLPLSGMRWRN